MLQELQSVEQNHGEPHRRWFADERFDLVVWQEANGQVVAFQLCYDKDVDERMLAWTEGKGFSHGGVDDGEKAPKGRGQKQSPVMVMNGPYEPGPVLQEFASACAEIDAEISGFMLAKLKGLAT